MRNLTTKHFVAFILTAVVLTVPMLAGAQFNPTRGANDANLSTISAYDLLVTIMQYGLAILTILGVIGFIVSGLIFITAGGAGKAETAKSFFYYSILGIIIGLVGFIVIRLIDGLLRGNPETT